MIVKKIIIDLFFLSYFIIVAKYKPFTKIKKNNLMGIIVNESCVIDNHIEEIIDSFHTQFKTILIFLPFAIFPVFIIDFNSIIFIYQIIWSITLNKLVKFSYKTHYDKINKYLTKNLPNSISNENIYWINGIEYYNEKNSKIIIKPSNKLQLFINKGNPLGYIIHNIVKLLLIFTSIYITILLITYDFIL